MGRRGASDRLARRPQSEEPGIAGATRPFDVRLPGPGSASRSRFCAGVEHGGTPSPFTVHSCLHDRQIHDHVAWPLHASCTALGRPRADDYASSGQEGRDGMHATCTHDEGCSQVTGVHARRTRVSATLAIQAGAVVGQVENWRGPIIHKVRLSHPDLEPCRQPGADQLQDRFTNRIGFAGV
jgi:hypothetical protein